MNHKSVARVQSGQRFLGRHSTRCNASGFVVAELHQLHTRLQSRTCSDSDRMVGIVSYASVLDPIKQLSKRLQIFQVRIFAD